MHAKKRTREILSSPKPALLSKEEGARVGAVAEKYGVLLADGKQIFHHA
jgi:hypothetical protein